MKDADALEPTYAPPPAAPRPQDGPQANPLRPTRTGTEPEAASDRNPVFSALVTEDTDVVGLVAYSVYKQNKHDFLVAFARANGREPSEAEIAAYTVGESTPRRLAIYRHLAQATLDGRGPDVQVAAGAPASAARKRLDQTRLLAAAIGLQAAILGYLLLRFGAPWG